jgi:hypothetical protein
LAAPLIIENAMNRGKKFFAGAVYVLALVAITHFVIHPATSSWYAKQEATASGYAVLAGEYVTLPPALQAAIRDRLQKGYLSNQDVWDSVGEIADLRPVQVSPAPDYGDAREPYNDFLWRSIRGEPLESKAKDTLISQVQ